MSESARAGASGAEPTPRTGARPASGSRPAKPGKGGKGEVRRSIPARVALFVRQVVAELKKVVRPSRADLVNYATAVLVFVAVVMAFVTVVDLGVGSLVGIVFGG